MEIHQKDTILSKTIYPPDTGWFHRKDSSVLHTRELLQGRKDHQRTRQTSIMGRDGEE